MAEEVRKVTVKGKVTVDGEKSLDRTAKSAQRVGNATKDATHNVHSYDRATKGAARASSNASKNFAKNAQVTEGLVPAYARLAAQVFAISAAFQFLKDSGDLVALQKGQIAYANATGLAMRSMTKDIIAATGAQVSFKDASQAAAIGTASGLNPNQLLELGKAAKTTSQLLGRDVTDSFNRLIRGVTKGEPELLDELGIILRLEAATKSYKEELGITGKLTAFQRSQAVTAEVLGQVENKYNKIIDIVDPGVNSFNKFAKSFERLLDKFREFVVLLGAPIAEFFTKNMVALTAALGLLGAKFIQEIIPGMKTWATTAQESAATAKDSYDSAARSARNLASEQKILQGSPGVRREEKLIARRQARGIAEQLNFKGGPKNNPGAIGALLDPEETKVMTTKHLKAIQTAVRKGEGQYSRLTGHMRTSFDQAINRMIMATEAGQKTISSRLDRIGNRFALTTTRLKTIWLGAMSTMKAAAAAFATAVTTLMRWAGIIGMLVMVGSLITGLVKKMGFFNEKMTDQEKRAETYISTVDSLVDEFETFVEVQKELGSATLVTAKNFAQLVTSFDKVSTSSLFKGLDSANKKLTSNLGALIEARKIVAEGAPTYTVQNTAPGRGGAVKGPEIERLTDEGERVTELASSYEELSHRAQAAVDHITLIREGLQNSAMRFSSTGKAFAELLDKFLSSDEITEGMIASYKRLTGEIQEVGAAITELGRLTDSNISRMSSLVDEMLPTTQFQELFSGLRSEIEIAEEDLKGLTPSKDEYLKPIKLLDISDSITGKAEFHQGVNSALGIAADEMKEFDGVPKLLSDYDKFLINAKKREERQERAKETKSLVLKFMREEVQLEQDRLKASTKLIKDKRSMTPLMREEADALNKIKETEFERRGINEEIGRIKAVAAFQERELAPWEEKRLQTLRLQGKELDAQVETQKLQLNNAYQLAETFRSSFESGLQSGLADFIKDKENSLKESIKKLAVGVLEGLADTLSKQLTTTFSTFLFGDNSPAGKMGRAIRDAADYAAVKWRNAIHGGAVGQIGTDLQGPPRPKDKEAGGSYLAGIGESLFGKEVTSKTNIKGKDEFIGEETQKVGGLFSDFTADLQTIFSKDAPFLESLGGLFSNLLGNLGGVFKSVLGPLMQGLGGGAGGLGGIITSLLPFASGGVASGGFRAFANGDPNVSRPTLGMVGEGRYNEAVVPLPDGKSIPVVSQGGSTSMQNNIEINIDAGGNTTTTSEGGSDDKAAELGKLVSGAVQQELQRQKRPGGILSPYGAA